MTEIKKTGYAERLKTAAEAKQALLAKLRAKPTVTDPQFEERAVQRAAELERVRQERTEARLAKKQAAAAAEEAVLQAQSDAEAAALEAKRGERKERKALSAADAKTKRDARYAARKARR